MTIDDNDIFYIVSRTTSDNDTINKYYLPHNNKVNSENVNSEILSITHKNDGKIVYLCEESNKYKVKLLDSEPYGRLDIGLDNSITNRNYLYSFKSGAFDSSNNFYGVDQSNNKKIIKISKNGRTVSQYYSHSEDIESIIINNRKTNESYNKILIGEVTDSVDLDSDELYFFTKDNDESNSVHNNKLYYFNISSGDEYIDTPNEVDISTISGYSTSSVPLITDVNSYKIKDICFDYNTVGKFNKYIYVIGHGTLDDSDTKLEKTIIKRCALYDVIDTETDKPTWIQISQPRFQDLTYLDKITNPKITYNYFDKKIYILRNGVKIHSIDDIETGDSFKTKYYDNQLKIKLKESNGTLIRMVYHSSNIYLLKNNSGNLEIVKYSNQNNLPTYKDSDKTTISQTIPR